ncbi:unnamed protein product, partial [marine sediment metagenome]
LWRTGMHASTLCKQEWGWESHTAILWLRPKTGKHLRATLPRDEARVILRVRVAGLLPTNTRTLRRWVARIGERAGHAGCCPLTLRHSRAVWLLDKGMPVNRVSHMLGCSYQTLERHYAQIEAARLVE